MKAQAESTVTQLKAAEHLEPAEAGGRREKLCPEPGQTETQARKYYK